MIPTIEEVFEKEIKSAEYCYGNPLPAEGWRDVACGMRDWARKLDNMRQGAASWTECLPKPDRKKESGAVSMSPREIEAACGVDVANMVEIAVLKRRAAIDTGRFPSA